MTVADFARMRDIERRYRERSGLSDRRFYSIFYGPLRPFSIAMLNENPGGTPDNFQIVAVEEGQHEYVEGRWSGRTTQNGAELLRRLLGATDFEPVRQVQIFNRFFRRSPHSGSFSARQKQEYAEEARPFLLECLQHTAPRLILFGGANAIESFVTAIGGSARSRPSTTIVGPNGSNQAVYYREVEISHPVLGEVLGVGIYHPSKLNAAFYDTAFPRLQARVREAFLT